MLTVTLICRDAVRKEIGFKLQKPRLPANTFGRHCSIELYWRPNTRHLCRPDHSAPRILVCCHRLEIEDQSNNGCDSAENYEDHPQSPRRLVFNDGQSDSSSSSYDAQKFWFTREK